MSNGGVTGHATGHESHRRQRHEHRTRLYRQDRNIHLLRAGLVGLLAGFLGVLYQASVRNAEAFSQVAAQRALEWPWIARVLFVVGTALIGGFAAGAVGRYAPESGGSGIPHIKAALLHLRHIRAIPLLASKFFGGLAALLVGMSFGREGPTVQMGSSVGKLVGDLLRVPKRGRDSLLAAGAGAGLAAAFNAPLAGFLFVMEELKREMSALTYGSALIASVCAVAITRLLLGQHASFELTSPGGAPLRVVPQVAVLGIVAGVGGVIFNRSLLLGVDLRRKFSIPRWLVGLVAGGMSGLALLYWPAITGGGHGLAESILSGNLHYSNLILAAIMLFAGKLLLTSASYSTGLPGGIFAPILVLGSLMGLAFGLIVHRVIPQTPFSAEGFATIGMACLLAGSVRAPLTGVVLIVEMTGEYSLLYALLVGAFVADFVAGALHDEPIYEALMERDLRQSGMEAPSDEEPILIEILVEPLSRMDGRRVMDLHLPQGAILVTVVRGSRHVIPGGSTILRAGDMATVMVEGDKPELCLQIHEASKAP